MTIKESAIGKLYFRTLEWALLSRLSKGRIHPNAFTIAGAAIAVAVPAGFAIHPLAGFFILAGSAVCDNLDGLAARSEGKTSRFGAFLDSTTDRISDFFYLSGFWVGFLAVGAHFRAATFLVYAAFMLTVLISYAKARIEGLGGRCATGLMERGFRTVYLLVWALSAGVFPGVQLEILWTGLTIYILLAVATVAQRVFYAAKTLQ